MRLAMLAPLVTLLLIACGPTSAPTPPAAETPVAATADLATEPAPAGPSALPPAPDPVAAVPASFSCRGNEPFWALDIGASGTAVLRTPETELVLAGAAVAGAGGAYTFQGTPEAGGVPVSALLVPAQCFDSMADGPAMPFSAQVGLPDGQVGSGCCTRQDDADPAPEPPPAS